jgi:hypothetical protein
VGCTVGPDVLEKKKSVASAGNRTLDRRPARSTLAMLTVEILKAFIEARIMVITISSRCSSAPRGRSEHVTLRCALVLSATAWHRERRLVEGSCVLIAVAFVGALMEL